MRRRTTEERETPGRPAVNPHFDTALRLTAIALLLRPMGPWFVRPVILAAAVVVLIFPAALRKWQVWGALAVLTAIRIANDWPLADNHIYLLGYWLLAVSLALRSQDAAVDARRRKPGADRAGVRVRRGVEGGAVARFRRRPVLPRDARDRPALRRRCSHDRRPVRATSSAPHARRSRSCRTVRSCWTRRRWSSPRGCGCSRWPRPGVC